MDMMEEQKLMLDNTLHMKDIIGTLKQTSQVVKEANKEINIEDLEDMKEQMDEVKADQEELNNFFKDYAEENQEDVDEELEELEQQMAEEDTGALPMANKEQLNQVQAQKNAEEEDLNNFLGV